MRRSHLSDKYQHIFKEKIVDFQEEEFRTLDGINQLQPVSEDFLTLNEEAIRAMIEIVRPFLTERQGQVIELLLQGKTQTEVAKALGINQSSICKTLHGNPRMNSTYCDGGLLTKFAKVLKQSQEWRIICRQIYEYQLPSYVLGTFRHLFLDDLEFQAWLESEDVYA